MRARIREEDFSYLPWIGYVVAGISTFGFGYLLLFRKEKEPELEKVVYEQSPPKKKKFEGF